MKYLLSVIVPCYNCEKTIESCLNSVPDEDEIQIIAVNDCSMDRTHEMLECIERKKVNSDLLIVDNLINKGAGESRNEGIRHASGEYIVFLDADDYFFPNYMGEVKSLLLSELYDCISFDAVEKYNERTKYIHMYFTSSPRMGVIPQKEALVYMRGCVCGKIFRKDIISDNHVTFPNITTSEDQVFVKTALACCQKIYHINKPLYAYVYMPNSLIHSGNNYSLEDEMTALRLIKERIEKDYPCEWNSIYFIGAVYGFVINRIKNGESIKNSRDLFRKSKKTYHRPDVYYSGYEVRFRLSYRLFAVGVFFPFKIVAKMIMFLSKSQAKKTQA